MLAYIIFVVKMELNSGKVESHVMNEIKISVRNQNQNNFIYLPTCSNVRTSDDRTLKSQSHKEISEINQSNKFKTS